MSSPRELHNRRHSADVVQSIRRASFIEAYGIKEVDEHDSSSSGGDDAYVHNGHRGSLTIEDLDVDMNSMDISMMDMDSASQQRCHRTKDSQESSSSSPTAHQLSSASNFAGGATRRKGDRQRRSSAQSRATHRRGVGDPFQRRATTDSSLGNGLGNGSLVGSFGPGGNGSLMGSFGPGTDGVSLASFTSVNSFTSSFAASGDPNATQVEVGNLTFVTDDEMAKLMYGDGSAKNAKGSDGRGAHPLSQSPSPVLRRSSDSTLSNSLPPSSILGVGSFSTVRLAWRKSPCDAPPDEMSLINAAADSLHSVGLENTDENGAGRKQRRSVVRVQSKIDDPDDPLKNKGELVAVKIIQKSILKQMKTYQKGPNNRLTVRTAFDNIEREIATMKRLKHPNLIRLFEVIDSVESDRLLMVLEYVSLGEILSHVEGTDKYRRMRYRKKVKGLTEEGHFDEKHSALYFVDIMHGLAYLHRNRICHRDLKPENILLCSSGIAKISDFGVSHFFEEEKDRESYKLDASDDDSVDDLISDLGDDQRNDGEQDSPTHLSKRESNSALHMSSRHSSGMLKKSEGTWCFWSPEMCNAESTGFSGYACDLWAAGVCLYIFTTGRIPFFSLLPSELFARIEEARIPYKRAGLSNELKDLLGKLLEKDPSTRAGVGDCLQHEFCASARMERIGELGDEFKGSEQHIILSTTDVKMALSVTMPGMAVSRTVSHRYSAPPSAFSCSIGTTADPGSSAPVSTTEVKNVSNLIAVTEDLAEGTIYTGTASRPVGVATMESTSNLTAEGTICTGTAPRPVDVATMKSTSNLTASSGTSAEPKRARSVRNYGLSKTTKKSRNSAALAFKSTLKKLWGSNH